jgi:K+-transporting ATPase ATPase C chain
MKTNILPAIRLTIVCLVFFSGIYTAIVFGVAQLAPNNGKGFVVKYESTKSDSAHTFYCFENIGQKFSDDRYFYSRPSAVDYNAAGSAGSNKGPSNPDYLVQVQARIDSFLLHNPDVKKSQIPSELVTASGSGLDPNISVDAAKVQIKRIAKTRGIAEPNVEQLILSNTETPLFGIFGPGKINVLKLNIALDNLN